MTDGPWNLERLRKYVKDKYSDPLPYLAQINSIDRTVGIFIYHMASAKTIIDTIDPKDQWNALELILTPKNKRFDLREAKLGIQAETQATVHNARSIHDMFSQVANSLLVRPQMDVSNCNILKLAQKLPASKLKQSIEEMLKSEAYSYVNSFINTIKHRNLVEFGARYDLQEGKAGVQFRGFEYGGNKFEPHWALQVLEKTLEVKNRIVMAGKLLNDELGIKNV